MEQFEKKEGHHALSRVYQKQWAHGPVENLKITLWDKKSHKNRLREVPIKSFSVVFGEFDMPEKYFGDPRDFETVFSKYEAQYPRILNTIRGQNRLIPKHEILLQNFVALTFSRSSQLRHALSIVLKDELMAPTLIGMFSSILDDENMESLRSDLKRGTDDDQLRLMTLGMMAYFCRFLMVFQCLILKPPEGRLWHTADEPVWLNWESNPGAAFLHEDSELLFPLSPDFLAFFYFRHPDENDNPLRKLPKKSTHEVDMKTWMDISQKIKQNATRDLIIVPSEIEHWEQVCGTVSPTDMQPN